MSAGVGVVWFKECIKGLFKDSTQLLFDANNNDDNNSVLVLDLQEFYQATMCTANLSDNNHNNNINNNTPYYGEDDNRNNNINNNTPYYGEDNYYADDDYFPRRGNRHRQGQNITVNVRLLTGQTFSLVVPNNFTIAQLTQRLREVDYNHTIPRGPLRMLRSARMSHDDNILRDFNPHNDEFICVPTSMIRVDLGFYCQRYNYNFTRINDAGRTFWRGGRPYTRPCGYWRLGLNVVAMYGNGAWLRDTGVPGEWAVSYHATGKCGGQRLAEYCRPFASHLRHTEAVFSTPDVTMAAQFAEEFSYNGQTYIIVLQNRLNPQTITEVVTPKGTVFVSPSLADVRSYCILYKLKGWQ